ncbi:hypothetical protein H5410_050796 [Solanum commersonii]|uniref:Uncharacterized protein n=1 Tax=Solanum commersonii TaxID=4109 RepID=A0A9J5WWG4_SOLCO|nr:hypothetical protein H5410_050796 [Solanum commersonii]
MENVNGWIHNHNRFIQLQQLVVEQQSEEIEHRMTRDDILSSVLGERLGYVRGKGYGKKPPKKTQIQQADIEASVSSAMESMRQEMQADMDRKLQEEQEQMTADLKKIYGRRFAKKIGRGALTHERRSGQDVSRTNGRYHD